MLFGCSYCCADGGGEDVVVQAQPSTPATAAPGLPVTESQDEGSDAFQPLPDDDDRQDDVLPPPPPLPEAAPAPAEADAEFLDFEATIDKSGGEKLCLDISAYDGKTLLVGRVKDGPVMRWNSEQIDTPWSRIQRGDRIIGINGKTGDSDELLGAARVDVLKLKMRRLLEFTVRIHVLEGGDPLNMEFDDSDGRCVVRSVSDGVASRANKRNTADLEIRPDDTVLQVNGESTSTAESVRVLTSICGDLEFRMRRPAAGTSPPK